VVAIALTIKGRISAITRDWNVQIMKLLKLARPALPIKLLGYIYTRRWTRKRTCVNQEKKEEKKESIIRLPM